MKKSTKLRNRWKGIIDTVIRFPLTIILLSAAIVINAIAIQQPENKILSRFFVTFIIGSFLYAVLELIYERFFIKRYLRILFAAITLFISAIYYFSIRNTDWDIEIVTRTVVLLLLLLAAFIWIPSLKSRISFNDTFMAIFKAFFTAVFFHGILFIGIALILGTTDLLLFSISDKAYLHFANAIFILIAPVYFLSLIPYYPGKIELADNADANYDSSTEAPAMKEGAGQQAGNDIVKKQEALLKSITPSKFLETLISYIIITLTAVFTIILLLYIFTNITGDFWTDSLMEPMLVTYSIVVIIVYLLASTCKNASAKYFRLIFPKVLVPVVLFQTVSSVLKIKEAGITYGRYYVILFGLFAAVSGIWFCIRPIQKNGMIAPLLIILSAISILPITNAFSISKANQTGRLKSTLERNEMLQDDNVLPSSKLSDTDIKVIRTSVQYLDLMNYTKDIKWLSAYAKSSDFEGTFGFPEYDYAQSDAGTHRYATILRDKTSPIPVAGYDFMAHLNLYGPKGADDQKITYNKNGKQYTLYLASDEEKYNLIIVEEDGKEIIRFNMNSVIDKFKTNSNVITLSTADLTFTEDNEYAALTVVADTIDINVWNEGMEGQAEVNILVKIR